MRFRIYLRRFGKLIKLYELKRTSAGLYIFNGHSPNYVTYHDDGKYWIRMAGKKLSKYTRQPLTSFHGAETLSTSMSSVWGSTDLDLDETQVTVRPGDIVIDRDGSFCIELMLSADPIELPETPERMNRAVYAKDDWRPRVIVEVFDPADHAPTSRFPPRQEWVEGTNFFYDHSGRI
jgi:hypothetical protein